VAFDVIMYDISQQERKSLLFFFKGTFYFWCGIICTSRRAIRGLFLVLNLQGADIFRGVRFCEGSSAQSAVDFLFLAHIV
jgi:hypothetical protein